MHNTTLRAQEMGHKHAEAYCLMWYGCACGHKERFWNSRDGVTPFGCQCPSCGDNLRHINFAGDVCKPGHRPHKGQRVWINMTRERAREIALNLLKNRWYSNEYIEKLIEDIYHEGTAPDLVVTDSNEQNFGTLPTKPKT